MLLEDSDQLNLDIKAK